MMRVLQDFRRLLHQAGRSLGLEKSEYHPLAVCTPRHVVEAIISECVPLIVPSANIPQDIPEPYSMYQLASLFLESLSI